MMTPFDWQEGMTHRASFVEARLQGGTPVVAASCTEGILMLTARRQAAKIYEVYDRLMVGLIGQQSDVESLRVAAIDFSHQEGFQRSEQDVTVQRVINAISTPLKRAFSDFNTAPFVARALFAEVGVTPADDVFYVLEYDGDYAVRRGAAFISGDQESGDAIYGVLSEHRDKVLSLKETRTLLESAWARGVDPSGEKGFGELTENLSVEAAVLRRENLSSAFESLATPGR